MSEKKIKKPVALKSSCRTRNAYWKMFMNWESTAFCEKGENAYILSIGNHRFITLQFSLEKARGTLYGNVGAANMRSIWKIRQRIGKSTHTSLQQSATVRLTWRKICIPLNCAKGGGSEFVERFLELSLFYGLSSPLNSEMICIFPYF